jgi:exonuclease VII small subunit
MSELDVDAAVAELERTAARLRAGDLEPEEAAELVERCAQLAAELGAALDRRASEPAGGAGQERLL